MNGVDKIFNILSLLHYVQKEYERLGNNGPKYSILKRLCCLSVDLDSMTNELPINNIILQARCETNNEDAFNETVKELVTESQSLLQMMNSLDSTINELFDNLYELCREEEKNSDSYMKLLQIREELHCAKDDEKVWHNLARSFGTRDCPHGKTLNEEDMEYISHSLNEYQSHFNIEVNDLGKMYDDYYDVMLPRLHKLEKESREQRKIVDEETRQLVHAVSINSIRSIADFLEDCQKITYSSGLPEDGLVPPAADKKKVGRPAYNKYDSFHDLCTSNENYQALVSFMNSRELHSFSTTYARTLKEYLIKSSRIHIISTEVFAELLIKEFSEKCSFTGVDSVRRLYVNDEYMKEICRYFEEKHT